MFDFSDKTVVVTGGSTGIGAEFARQLAAKGARLVLVARGEERMKKLAAELGARHEPVIIAEDLSKPGASARVVGKLRALGLTVDVLVNNAGFGSYGAFEEQTLANQREQIELNVGALVELTHLLLPDVTANKGGILNVASTVAFQPVPYMAVYGATKAFVLSFSEALWAEYQGRGVRVTALCPGATDTSFFDRASKDAAKFDLASPAGVVAAGLRAFSRGKASVVPGAANKLMTFAPRLTSRQTTARLAARVMRPKAAQLVAAKPITG